MRVSLLLLPLTFCLISCGDRSTKTDTSASSQVSALPDTLCFRQIMGRDSTLLQLVFTDSLVTGELAVLPFEKDRARGPITGTRSGNEITANWQRSGEGVTQPYQLNFTLEGDSISWREGERIEQAGKWVLKDPGQGFQYTLAKTDCR